ncbi:complement regulator-acquiring protein [Borreliella lusitaniae]|uniref:Complement regulator-acquiring protein n=1 Tax=Borreliella lusitaniae TaxID=100177 RepID=A0ABZ0CPU6_9SPIR|nr:complement regulator-acquiring protein [Borreliella lusitaniae]WNY69176.1 complement regulator-acquiring protein [Borreliella lusitaniae]
MTKIKLNMIKLNIIKAALALICISCAPAGILSPKLNKEISIFEKDKDSKPSKKDYKKYEAKRLKALVKQLEAQRDLEDREIAKIDSKSDFLSTFEISSNPDMKLSEDQRIALKRIIYSSLNYETQKINTLKEILEKLKAYYFNNKQHVKFMNHPALSIQITIEEFEKEIKETLPNLNQEEEKLLNKTEKLLRLKKEFAKNLNTIIQAYNQDLKNIKTNDEELIHYVQEAYKNFKFEDLTNY